MKTVNMNANKILFSVFFIKGINLVDSDINAVSEGLSWATVEARIWIWWV